MLDTTSGSQGFRWVTLVLGLVLAFGATACNGGPTEPTLDELPRIYTGRWRGTINGFEVVLDVRAERGRPEHGGRVGLEGTGTAHNSVTAETHGLTVLGQTAGENSTLFLLSTALEIGPGGVILGGGKVTGIFEGSVSRDGRTWPGRFTSDTAAGAAPIFGPGVHSVTLIKE